jgi:ABC-2 type transport system permease protein
MTTGTIAMRGLLASEWTKVRSLRSTYLTIASAAAIAVAGGVVSADGRGAHWATMTAAQRAEFDPVSLSYDGFAFAQLAFGLLGVLAISSEYGTGTIRTTFAAVPHRRMVLAAKYLIVGALGLVVGEILSFATFLLAQATLSRHGLGTSLRDPHALRSVIAAGGYLLVLALLGLGVGAVLRNTAAAITVVFGLVFLIPLFAEAVSHEGSALTTWNLWAAANTLVTTIPLTADQPSPTLSCLICAVHVILPLTLATLLITRRDA